MISAVGMERTTVPGGQVIDRHGTDGFISPGSPCNRLRCSCVVVSDGIFAVWVLAYDLRTVPVAHVLEDGHRPANFKAIR